MTKRCHTFDHTADVGLEAHADTLEELLEALAEGLADFICRRDTVCPCRQQEIAVWSEDCQALTVDFLSKVLSVIQTDRFVLSSVHVESADENSALARVAGEAYDPARHELHTEVKAVTYHMLKACREGDGWVGRVVLDL